MGNRNTRIRSSQIENILPSDIEAINEITDLYYVRKASGQDKWEWVLEHTRQHSIVASADHSDKADYIDTPYSPMILTGGVLSEGTNAGTLKVTALTALLRTTDSTTGALAKVTLSEQDNQAIASADTIYKVVLDYNENSPQILIQEATGDGKRKINIGECMKESDDTVHFVDGGFRFAEGIKKTHHRAGKLRDWEISSDITIADEGSKYFSISSGDVFKGINAFTFVGLDTSASANVFTYVYYDGDLSGGADWVYVKDQTEIDVDNYNDVDTGLDSCTKFKCDWVFIHPDMEHVYVVYGQDNEKLGAISDSVVPNVPDLLDTFGVLIGRIIIEGGVATFERIEMVQVTTFNPQVVIDHNDNSNIQGGTTDEYYHLTSADYTELTEWLDNITLGSDGKLTLVSGVAIDEFSSDGTLAGNSDLAVPTEKAVKTYADALKSHSIVDSAYHSDKVDYVDTPQSPTILTGGVLSEGTNAGTFKVTALTALIRTSASDTAPLTKISLAEQDNQAITLTDTRYIVVLEYNGGSPQIQISDSIPNGQTNIDIGEVLKNTGDKVHFMNCGNRLESGVYRLHKRNSEVRYLEIASGLQIADEGSQLLSITSGVAYRGINRFAFPTFDTSKSSPDTFTYVYYDGDLSAGADWVYVPDQTEIDVDYYNDVSIGLDTLKKIKCDWVFIHPDDNCVFIVYGQDDDVDAVISESTIPTLPDVIDSFGILIGRILIDTGVATFYRIDTVETFPFTPQVVYDHNDSSNIQGGTTDEYYHLTSAEYTELSQWLDNVTLGSDGKLTLPSGTAINEFSIDGTLVGNSDDAVPTEKAVKTYVDNNIPDLSTSVDDFTIKYVNSQLKIAERIEQNIMLNAFRIAINGSLVKHNMIDGITDEFEDESGMDLDECILETYDPTNDLFTTYLAEIELDYMEYSTDALAQSAYLAEDVCTGGTVTADYENPGEDADQAFDDNVSTRWGAGQAGGYPHWIKYEFASGITETIRQLRIKSENSPYVGKDFTFEGSNNDSDWDVLLTDQLAQIEGYQSYDISESAQGAYRYYKVNWTTGWGANDHIRVYEIEMIETFLQCYSESTIKQQGSYSLKCIAEQTNSLNKSLTNDLETNIDLTNVGELKFYVYASRVGTNIQLQIHDSGGTTSTKDVLIESGEDSAWKQITWDTSGISTANKDDIDQLIIKIINADAENTFYIDEWIVPERKNDITLISKATVAEAEPSNARIIIFEEDTDSVTINTDLKAYVTKEYGSGATWAEVTLVDEGDYESGKRVLSGIVDLEISGMGSGTNMAYKIVTLNSKELNLHGCSLLWSD